MKTALTIAGSDSSAGAGIQADLRTFNDHDIYGVCAITAVTCQNTVGVSTIHQVPADIVASQIEAVVTDISVSAVKIGMLTNRSIVEVVAQQITDLSIPSVVIDPVVVSSSGQRLLDTEAIVPLKTKLLPKATCITPNRMEAELLSDRPVKSLSDARDAARSIVDLGAGAVVITGGHFHSENAIDIFFDGHDVIELVRPRLAQASAHGTGCIFSAAITAALAQGQSLPDAVGMAKSYVFEIMQRGIKLGAGEKILTKRHKAKETR